MSKAFDELKAFELPYSRRTVQVTEQTLLDDIDGLLHGNLPIPAEGNDYEQTHQEWRKWVHTLSKLIGIPSNIEPQRGVVLGHALRILHPERDKKTWEIKRIKVNLWASRTEKARRYLRTVRKHKRYIEYMKDGLV